MNRKIFKSGNSLVVSLPSEYLDRLQLQDGSEVDIALGSTSESLVLKPAISVAGITPEFAERVERFIDAYRPALESLSER